MVDTCIKVLSLFFFGRNEKSGGAQGERKGVGLEDGDDDVAAYSTTAESRSSPFFALAVGSSTSASAVCPHPLLLANQGDGIKGGLAVRGWTTDAGGSLARTSLSDGAEEACNMPSTLVSYACFESAHSCVRLFIRPCVRSPVRASVHQSMHVRVLFYLLPGGRKKKTCVDDSPLQPAFLVPLSKLLMTAYCQWNLIANWISWRIESRCQLNLMANWISWGIESCRRLAFIAKRTLLLIESHSELNLIANWISKQIEFQSESNVKANWISKQIEFRNKLNFKANWMSKQIEF